MKSKLLLLLALLSASLLHSQSYSARVFDFCSGAALEEVHVTLSGFDTAGAALHLSALSDADGMVIFDAAPFAPNSTLRLSASANTLSISTYELMLFSQHLLGNYDFTNAYQWIAADVNSDFMVSMADRVTLAGNIISPPPGGNWRFFPKNFSFTDPAMPLNDTFPNHIAFINGEILNLELYGVQLGNVSRTGCITVSNTSDAIAKEFKIAPNPTADIWTLTFTETDANRIVQLTDLTGRVLRQTAAPDLQISLSAAPLPAGFYILNICQDGQPDMCRTVVKQ